MKPRLFIAFAIFLGSYLPLSTILLVQDFDKKKAMGEMCLNVFSNENCHFPLQKPWLSIGFLVLCLICFLCSWIALKVAKDGGTSIHIKTVKHTPSDLMNYVLPYIVSFMSIDYMQDTKFIGFLIFLFWLFWLSYKSGQIILNPMLVVLNWRMYEITYYYPGNNKDEFSSVVLSNKILEPNTTLKTQTIQSVIVINKEEK